MSWRSYGPGKYATIVDSYISRAHTSQETGSVAEYGWYGMVEGDLADIATSHANEDHDELTVEELQDLSLYCGALLAEDSQGFVEVCYFSDVTEMYAAWDELEKALSEYEEEC